MRFSRLIAGRYLWSRRKEAFITIITVVSVIGVAIGVMVLNVTMAVMSGFENELKNKITNTNSHILVRSIGGKLRDWRNVKDLIAALPGVNSVSPYTQQQALIRTRDRSSGILIRGVQKGSSAASQLASYSGLDVSGLGIFNPPETVVPSLDEGEEKVRLPGLAIGQELARSMGLFKGGTVSVLSPQVSSTPLGLVPRFRRFVVSDIYHSGLVEYESGLAYVSLEEAQRFFDLGESVSGLEVRVDDINASPAITGRIMERVGGGASGIYAQDWTEMNKPLWDALRLEKNVYFIVLLLIVVMASFSIVTTLIMLVLEKRRDIAVLCTLGATARQIRQIFVLQGAIIGALGTVLGLLAGYLGCLALREYGFPLDERIFQMSTVPVRIVGVNFATVGVCSFIICCLATIYPAFRAAGLQPSEVLRYE